MLDYRDYYNHHRPHSALQYLYPIDYYRGDPVARLTERGANLRIAAAARAAYWQQHRTQAAQSLSLFPPPFFSKRVGQYNPSATWFQYDYASDWIIGLSLWIGN